MIYRIRRKLYSEIVERHFRQRHFPTKGTTQLLIDLKINHILDQLKKRNLETYYGGLYTLPNTTAVKAWQKLLPQNPNHIGNRSINATQPLYATFQIEKDLIDKMIHLYHGSSDSIEGYISSGATEGNIFAAWIGRKYINKTVRLEKICLIRTDLAHYSITKAADVVGIQSYIAPLDRKLWNMSIDSLEKLIAHLYTKGFRGFLLPLTLGYTAGGTSDDYKKIIHSINKLTRKYSSVKFFIWLDAAFAGLISPFTTTHFSPFAINPIQLFIADFHKFMGVPYPAGLILYRKNLRQLIEKPIPYLKENDTTLLGSRTGLSSVATWSTIHKYGTEGFKQIISNCLNKKKTFLSLVRKKFPATRIISDDKTLQAALVVTTPLPDEFCEQYGLHMLNYSMLFENGRKIMKVYKLFFLPHFD